MGQENIILSYKHGVREILLNRPAKKNAMNPQMYETLKNTLNEDAKNDQIVVTIITGAGDYFTSGNDLSAAMSSGTPDQSLKRVQDLVEAFIKYPKILISVLNGPAIGIGATLSALCDVIYASETAVFDTPFLKLGLCAEGASSFTFPTILGKSKASEMLLLNHRLSAKEAYQFGLVSQVVPHESLKDFIASLYKYGSLSVNSVKRNKKLITDNFNETLIACCRREMATLKECSESEEMINAIMEFMSKKSKSKL